MKPIPQRLESHLSRVSAIRTLSLQFSLAGGDSLRTRE
jgi:hypothetical protein